MPIKMANTKTKTAKRTIKSPKFPNGSTTEVFQRANSTKGTTKPISGVLALVTTTKQCGLCTSQEHVQLTKEEALITLPPTRSKVVLTNKPSQQN